MVSDDLSLGRVIVEQAHTMGADTFAHISFPRHLAMENFAARREQMMSTAERLGMVWVDLTAPDPATEGFVATQMFLLDNVPRWIADHGQNTAFFATSCGMQAPLIIQIVSYGGFFPLQCCPSPFHALPAAFNISMHNREGDVGFLLEQLQAAVNDLGASGRISTWPVPMNMLFVEVGVLYSIEFLEGRTNGRHDRAVLERIVAEVAATYGANIELSSNWQMPDGSHLDNFYLLLSDFIDF